MTSFSKKLTRFTGSFFGLFMLLVVLPETVSAQTILLQEDFETNNISTTVGSYPYANTDACSGIFGWRKNVTWSALCTGCATNAATIQITSACAGVRTANLFVGTFVPTSPNVQIQFDYGYERDAAITSSLRIELHDLTAVTSQTLTFDVADVDLNYNNLVAVIPGNTYEIELTFFAIEYFSFGHGASFDNLIVSDPCTFPDADIAVLNDCANDRYQVEVTVNSVGSGTGVDILGDLVAIYSNVGPGTYLLPSPGTYYSTGTAHDIAVDGSGYGGCVGPAGFFAGCQADTCLDALDILDNSQTGFLSAANIDAPPPLLPNFIQCGNGSTLASCDWGNTNFGYSYSDFTDLWYSVDIPDGSDEFTVDLANLTGPVMIIPYTGTCASLTQLPIDNSVNSTTNGSCPYLSGDGSITFDDVSAYSTGPIYIRVIPQDDNTFGTAGCPGNTLTYGSFDIIASSPQPNDICANAPDITTNFGGTTSSGNLSSANDEGTLLPVSGTCDGTALNTTGQDLWYQVNMPPADPVKLIELTLTFDNAGDSVYAFLYDGGCFDFDQPELCAPMSSSVAGEEVTVMFDPAAELLTSHTYFIRLLQSSNNPLAGFSAEALILDRNTECDVFNGVIIDYQLFDGVNPVVNNADFNFSTNSGVNFPNGSPTTETNYDLFFIFDPILTSHGNGLQTWSGEVDFDINGLAPGESLQLVLYERSGYSGNCGDYEGDLIDSVSISSDGIAHIGCLDMEHGSSGVGDGYIVRVIQTSGAGTADITISATPDSQGPPPNDQCDAIYNGTGATFEGGFYDITNATMSADFTFSRSCTGIADSCNGISLSKERDLWFLFEVPDDNCPNIQSSSYISTATVTYDAGNSFLDAYVYVYSACDEDSILACGSMDGAGETLNVSGLIPGETYLVRVMPNFLNSNEEYPFDISSQLGPVQPCNDIAGSAFPAPPIQSGFDRTNCPVEILSAQGATETANLADSKHDVWFRFTAPDNGGPWVLDEGYISIYLESVSAHLLTLEVFELVNGNVASGNLGSVNTNTEDEARLHLGHLIPGKTYYIRVAHTEQNTALNNVEVLYRLCLFEAESIIGCPQSGLNMVTRGVECDNDCARYYKIDLPESTPSGFYRIEVIGDGQDVDARLFYQGMDSPSNEGNLTDYDHPCNATSLVPLVSTGPLADPGSCNGGTGEWSVYNLIGPVPGQRNFFYLEVYDPISVLGCGGLPVCEVNLFGPYDNQLDAETSGSSPTLSLCFDNSPPSPQADFDTTTQGDLIEVDVSMNDTDIDGNLDPSTVIVINGPTSGASTTSNGSGGVTVNYGSVPGFCGADTLVYVICDFSNACASDTLFLEVNCQPGNPPVAHTDFYSTAQGTSVSTMVISNDTDPDGNLDPGSVTILVPATSGASTVSNGMGGIVLGYGSVPGFCGEDTVVYQVCDSLLNCDSDTLFMMVICDLNLPPVANTDFGTVPQAGNVSIQVTTNDTDPDDDLDPSSVSVLSGPNSGASVITLGEGSIFVDYSVVSGFCGIDTLVYQVCDQNVNCDSDTMFIDVICNASLPPVAIADFDTTIQGNSVSTQVSNNDSDPDGDLDEGSVFILEGPGSGVPALPDGLGGIIVDYTSQLAFCGQDTIVYQICDFNLNCDSDTLFMEVTCTNNTPPIAQTDYETGPQGGGVFAQVGLNDTDPDGDLDISSVSITIPPSSGAIATPDGSGNIIVDYTSIPTFCGSDTVVYQVCDFNLNCDSDSLFIEILCNLNTPPVANADYDTVTQGGFLSPPVSSNDTDADADLNPTSVSVISAPSSGAMAIPSGNGAININYGLVPLFCGADTLVYQICDLLLNCDEDTLFTEVICDLNAAPLANPDVDTTNPGNIAFVPVSANDTDSDADLDVSTVTVVLEPASGATATPNGSGGIDVDYAGIPNYCGPDSLTYSICDLNVNCDTAWVYIEVSCDANFPPVANPDLDTIPEDGILTSPVSANDSDPEGDLVPSSVVIVSFPSSGATAVTNSSGDVIINYTNAPGFCGPDTLVYQICDADGACDTDTLFVAVLCDLNSLPDAQPDFVSLPQSGTLNVPVGMNDTDADGDLDLSSVTVLSGPVSGAPVAVDGFGGVLVDYSSLPGFCGADTLVYEICDENGNCDSDTLFLEVVCNVNSPAVAVPDHDSTAQGVPLTSPVSTNDTDPDGDLDPTSVSVVLPPSSGAPAVGDGSGGVLIDYAAIPEFCGADTVLYEICDLNVNCDTDTLFVQVECSQSAPVANPDYGTGSQGQSSSWPVALNDTDADGDLQPVSVIILSPATSGATTTTNGLGGVVVDYSVIPGFCALDTVVYQICDAQGNCDSDTLFVDVPCGFLSMGFAFYTASEVNNEVQLDWRFMGGKNGNHFEIQRSVDKEKFEQIGSVHDQGDENHVFTDRSPKLGLNHYRIHRVDANQGVSFSRTLSVLIQNRENEVLIYPNPASTQLNVRCEVCENVFDLQLSDLTGKLVLSTQGQSQKGEVNVEGIARGTYILQVYSKELKEVVRKKVVITR